VSLRFTIEPFEFYVLPARTRFPFRYGIASMTDVPHLFVRTRVECGGRWNEGITAEGLPPKWFTKDPDTSFEHDLRDMLDVIRHAAEVATAIGRHSRSFFQFWRSLSEAQHSWADERHVPPLLSGLGVSIVERAVLDGLCRVTEQPLHRLIAANSLGIRLGDVYPELSNAEPGDLLPNAPLGACYVRHTIGLADALTDEELGPADRVDDGLPQDLATSIRAYGLRYFKVKLSGTPRNDSIRLRNLLSMLAAECAGTFWLTVDGNENFHDFGAFRDFWEQVHCDSTLAELPHRTLVVEQPVHRDRALTSNARDVLLSWRDRPPVIIDESDGALGDVPRALDSGYAGASFKSCKGIVKGIANACLLAMRRDAADRPAVLTGEDLCTLGPVALQQDLAMMALLGIPHVERNGHHYYRGLDMMPREWQEVTREAHSDLYNLHPLGFAHLRIEGGALDLSSVNESPYGLNPLLNVSRLTPLEKGPANVLKF
jgi:hypothetical protein